MNEITRDEKVLLSSLTSFGLGGPAGSFFRANNATEIVQAIRGAHESGDDLLLLGAGSNLLVADGGFPGTVVAIRSRGITFRQSGAGVLVTCAAGEKLDDLVELCTRRGLAGLECLSGIPGLVGAAPVQNVGAFGQELSDTVTRIRAFDIRLDEMVDLGNSECGFGYRHSIFRSDPGHYAILEVEFQLSRGFHRPGDYTELERVLRDSHGPKSTAAQARQVVLQLRRRRGLLLDASFPESRSAGCFFVNPVLPRSRLEGLLDAFSARGISREAVPLYPVQDGDREMVKLSAAWLMEQSGFSRGYSMGRAGLSPRHVLVLYNLGDARATDILRLAEHIQCKVRDRWGIRLEPEPIMVGFGSVLPEPTAPHDGAGVDNGAARGGSTGS